MPGWGLGPGLHSPEISTCSCSAVWTRNVYLAFDGSTQQDLTMVPGDITDDSYQSLPHYPKLSSSISLHCAHIVLFLSILHFSTAYLPDLSVPWAPAVISGVVSGVLCPSSVFCHRTGVISGMFCTPGPVWYQTGGHLSLASCPGPVVPVWCLPWLVSPLYCQSGLLWRLPISGSPRPMTLSPKQSSSSLWCAHILEPIWAHLASGWWLSQACFFTEC